MHKAWKTASQKRHRISLGIKIVNDYIPWELRRAGSLNSHNDALWNGSTDSRSIAAGPEIHVRNVGKYPLRRLAVSAVQIK